MTTPSTPGIYRLVSPQLTNGAKHTALNDNATFVTNIPSLDYAIRIWRIRWIMGWSAWAASLAAATPIDVQVFAQLTENQSKTSILVNDTSFLDETYQHFLYDDTAVTAAGEIFLENMFGPLEVVHDFNMVTTPWTVATKFNVIASMIENTSNLAAGAVFKPICQIEYTLERLDTGLRDYLAKRLQIQGS